MEYCEETAEDNKSEDATSNINQATIRAAAIGVAARRVEITRKQRDRALEEANDTAKQHRYAINKLDEVESELRVEEFTLQQLMEGN